MSVVDERLAPAADAASAVPAQEARILIVDDEPLIRSLLARRLCSLGYLCDECPDGERALRVLDSRHYDMVLADIMMPGMGGQTLLREALKLCPDLAVILVTGVSDIGVAVDSIKLGAYDYITKPFRLGEVALAVNRALERQRLRIENQVYQQTLEDQVAHRTRQLKETLDVLRCTYHSTLEALGTALDSREADSKGHSLRIMMYAALIARRLGLSEMEIRSIEQAALLHDIGKIGVPDELLVKPGRLAQREWELMRKHPETGYRILAGIKFLRAAAEIVLHHQERYDGTGYPAGLQGEDIALGARIIAVADTLECMTSDRPFQKAASFEAAREEIMRVAGTQLDPWIVNAFIQIPIAEFQALRQEPSLPHSFDVSGLILDYSIRSLSCPGDTREHEDI